MKSLRLFIFSLVIILAGTLIYSSVYSQSGEWTWVKGDSIGNSLGSHGVLGVPSPTNEPTPRYACGSWTDTAGNFWVYSGVFAPGDLWKFDIKTLEWTWMAGDSVDPNPYILAAKGVYDPLNAPGQIGYGMITWITPNNHLWLYGGLLNTASGNQQQLELNDDLWQFDPSINEWAWMGAFGSGANEAPVYGKLGVPDSSNMPGGREEGNCSWTDNNGNLWFFGAWDVNFNSYNDLWKYDVATGIWTWMSGSQNLNDNGQYGFQGEPLNGNRNYPAARSTNFFWKDTAGNFWLSGGTQAGGTTFANDYFYQDTWEFNPNNLDWTWVTGPRGNDRTSSGVDCQFDSTNLYGAHYENRATWKHCDDLIITYNGFNDWKNIVPTNDMWGYKISTNEWVKLNEWGSTGNYGTQGVASPLNYPPTRLGGVGFTESDGSLWLFGGQTGTGLFYNDLWKYVIDTACVTCVRNCNITPPVISSNLDTICANDSAVICAPVTYTTYNWNQGGTANCISVNAAGDYYVSVTSSNGCSAESNHVHIYVYPVLPVSITQQGDTLISFGAVSYQWFLNGTALNGATSDTLIATQPGSYTVQVTDINGCEALSPVSTVTSVGIQQIDATMFISVFPNPNSTGTWQLSVDNSLVGSKLDIYDNDGRLVWQSEIRNPVSVIAPNLEGGIYWLRISSANSSTVRKLVRL